MVMNAVGVVELSSIAEGYRVQDTMLKTADTKLIVARTICSGKYIVIVGGDVAGVTSSVEAGEEVCPDGIIDTLVIPNVHESVFPAISGVVPIPDEGQTALGVIETFSASSAIEAGDAAVKAANVILFRIHLAMAVGGKGFVQVSGDVASVHSAVEAGADAAGRKGLLVSRVTIAAPRKELFGEFI